MVCHYSKTKQSTKKISLHQKDDLLSQNISMSGLICEVGICKERSRLRCVVIKQLPSIYRKVSNSFRGRENEKVTSKTEGICILIHIDDISCKSALCDYEITRFWKRTNQIDKKSLHQLDATNKIGKRQHRVELLVFTNKLAVSNRNKKQT